MTATYLDTYWDTAKSANSYWGECTAAGNRLVLATFEWPPRDASTDHPRKTRHIVFLFDSSAATPARSVSYEPAFGGDEIFLGEARRDGSRINHGKIAPMSRDEFWNVALDKLFGTTAAKVAPPRSGEKSNDKRAAGTPVDDTDHSRSELLMSAARPELYRSNAFRIMGLSVEATSADITRQFEKLRMVEKYGGGKHPPSALPLTPAPNADQIREAADRLRDPERRLVDEFFWFWPHLPGGGQSDEALLSLRQREEEQAAAIWKRQGNAGSTSNVSIHNLAVLMHARVLDQEFADGAEKALSRNEREQLWKSAYQMWKVLLDDDGFWARLTARIRDLDDPRLTTGTARRIRTSLPLALLHIQAQLAVRAAEAGNADLAQWHLARMKESGFPASVVEEAVQLGAEPIRKRLKTASHAADKESDVYHERGADIADRLLRQCGPALAALDMVLPEGNSARDGIHDEIAIVVLGCQIVFAKKTENWRKSTELLERVLPIAAGTAARGRVSENLRIVRANRDANVCFFCSENDADEKCVIKKPMYGDVERVPNFNVIGMRTGTKITWRSREVAVPRCLRCKAAQSSWAGWTALSVIISIATGIVSAIIESNLGGPPGIVAALLFSFGIGGTVTGTILSKRYFRKNIRAEGDANKYGDIQELLKKGWHFGTRPQT